MESGLLHGGMIRKFYNIQIVEMLSNQLSDRKALFQEASSHCLSATEEHVRYL